MTARWMLYGANGYTGRLTARLAKQRGMEPILAGRSHAPIEALSGELGLEGRVFDLRDTAALRTQLEGVSAVVHMAGPFSATSGPMVEACLQTGTHYLDVTGEIDVFEAVMSRGEEASEAGVTLMPGVGFDVVPTDCLAAKLAALLPGAEWLEIAFLALGKPSAGTTKTMIEGIPKGGRIRENGTIKSVPAAWKEREIPLPSGPRTAVSIPWGDVSTAWYSTGIPNIIVYSALPASTRKMMRRVRRVSWLVGARPVQALMKWAAARRVTGPSQEERERGYSEIWAEVRDAEGARVSGTLTTPEGYTLTADSSLRALERILAGDVASGALTPSQGLGADFVETLDGVTPGAIVAQ